MRFKSSSDMARYIQQQINSGNTDALKSFKDKKGNAAIPVVSSSELQEAADALKQYLYNRLKDYFDSYSPVEYQRTGKLLESLRVEPVTRDGVQSYRVFFDQSGAVRDSLWDGQPQGDLPALLNDGYQVSSGWHRGIEHFGFFEGFGFIQNAMDDALVDPRFKGVKIEYNAGS